MAPHRKTSRALCRDIRSSVSPYEKYHIRSSHALLSFNKPVVYVKEEKNKKKKKLVSAAQLKARRFSYYLKYHSGFNIKNSSSELKTKKENLGKVFQVLFKLGSHDLSRAIHHTSPKKKKGK